MIFRSQNLREISVNVIPAAASKSKLFELRIYEDKNSQHKFEDLKLKVMFETSESEMIYAIIRDIADLFWMVMLQEKIFCFHSLSCRETK